MGRDMDEARQTAEGYLVQERDNLTESGILRSEVRVIESLLKHGESLVPAYAELFEKRPGKWPRVLDGVITTAAFWSPELIALDRDAVRRVEELTDSIVKSALNLADLLRDRREVMERHGIRGPVDSHPLDILEAGVEPRADYAGRFSSYVLPKLKHLSAQFDLKYWPPTADLLDGLALIQTRSGISPYHAFTLAAMDSRQGSSPLDFIRALRVAIEEYDVRPDEFSHRFFAEVTNAALDLPPEKIVTREAVKAMRAYARKLGR